MTREIKDSVIKSNVQRFVSNWMRCRRALLSHGYYKSTVNTYEMAKLMILYGGSPPDKYTAHLSEVDYLNLARIVELQKNGELVFFSLQFPNHGILIKEFYFRQRDSYLYKFVHNDYVDFSGQVSVLSLISSLEKLRESDIDENLKHRVEMELGVLDMVQDFMEISDNTSSMIIKQINSHSNAAKAELNRCKSRMMADEYLSYERERFGQITRLSTRVSITMNLMLNCYEN